MTSDSNDTARSAEAAYRKLASLYARAMDRNEPDLLDAILVDDIVIDGAGLVLEGIAAIRDCPAILCRMYHMTQHVVHNQTLTLDGDEAEGETYCTASHVIRPAEEGGEHSIYVWAIRYQDRIRRLPDGWRFSRRTLVVDWSEVRSIKLGIGA